MYFAFILLMFLTVLAFDTNAATVSEEINSIQKPDTKFKNNKFSRRVCHEEVCTTTSMA